MLQGIADFALGKFRVTSLRESVIDFSSPFMYEPAGMAMRRPQAGGNVCFLYSTFLNSVSVRGFLKCTELAILASEALLRENKKK